MGFIWSKVGILFCYCKLKPVNWSGFSDFICLLLVRLLDECDFVKNDCFACIGAEIYFDLGGNE